MDHGNLLLTGATGALGPPLLEALLSREAFERIYLLIRPGTESLANRFAELLTALRSSGGNPALLEANLHRLIPVAADVTNEMTLDADVEVVIHAAADTRFRAPPQEQQGTNIGGTRNLIQWAGHQKRLKRFVFVSTICVAGHRKGSIPEVTNSTSIGFTNEYESTKWQAEQLVRASGLPITIARVSLVIGSDRTGSVHRPGAVQYALRWMYRGLVPMIPGTSESAVDLVSSELAAMCLSKIATNEGPVPDVIHIAAGLRAIPLQELLDFTIERFREMSPAWRQGKIARPMIVDSQTFEMFRDTVHSSGDVLFRSVLDSVGSFLPGLLYPKRYETTRAEQLMGEPLPLSDWRPLIGRVIHQCINGDNKRVLPREVCVG